MHARTAEVLSALDNSRDALMQSVLRVPTSLHEAPPAPGRWSAAQVVEHLAIVEARIIAVMQNLLAAARACLRAGVPYVWEPHGMLVREAYAQKRWKKELFMALGMRRALCGACPER